MTNSSGGKRFDTIDRIIAMSLALVTVGACSKDATSPPTPSVVTVVGGASQTATVGTGLATPVVIRVTDGAGNPVAGVAVTFTPTAGSGSIAPAQATTDASGSAQATWTLGTVAGTDSIMVAAGALAPVAIVATATPDVPVAMTIVGGNDQSAPAGSALSAPLAVKVTDQYGNAVPNATVQWSDDSNGTLATSTTVTDANGMAQDTYTLGPSAGPEGVVATLMNATVPVSAAFTEMGN